MTEKHHGYTNHGHPIPGACGIAGQSPKYVARCGGPRVCGTCSLDAERYNESRPDSNEPPTMTDQTPSTEDVRWKYRCMRVKDGAKDIAAQTEFDAWLAAHDREVAAKALYDARDDWRKGGWAGTPHHHDRGRDRIAAAQYVGNWLDTRADQIEAGE